MIETWKMLSTIDDVKQRFFLKEKCQHFENVLRTVILNFRQKLGLFQKMFVEIMKARKQLNHAVTFSTIFSKPTHLLLFFVFLGVGFRRAKSVASAVRCAACAH